MNNILDRYGNTFFYVILPVLIIGMCIFGSSCSSCKSPVVSSQTISARCDDGKDHEWKVTNLRAEWQTKQLVVMCQKCGIIKRGVQ